MILALTHVEPVTVGCLAENHEFVAHVDGAERMQAVEQGELRSDV
jgi:predicted 2-oxoglutarate/Fe(II)-dependent dioxygenase YbiX